MNRGNSNNPVVIKSFELALASIHYCSLLESKQKFIISNQLLRCCTSVGANIREAQNAESRKDFIHKMKLAAKELEETEYWLELCSVAQGFPDPGEVSLAAEPVRKMLNKIISTSLKMQKKSI